MARATGEAKTKPTDASVEAFLEGVEPAARAADARVILAMMEEITGAAPVMWGPSIIGFGRYTYQYQSGRIGEWPRIGFSPRKANMVIYLIPGFEGAAELLAQLGKHKIGASCLYLGSLAGVDLGVLRTLCDAAWADMARRYPLA